MERFDFDTLPGRRNTGSLKWDVAEEELPMWVADMDFAAAPCIRKALQERIDTQVFGYSIVREEWYDAYRNWWGEHHGLAVEKDWLIFTTGVIPALSTAVRKFTTPAEKVIIQTPVYNVFFSSVINNGRRVLESPLKYTGDSYEMDLADLEEKMADPQATMFLLCNPQNPCGKIWSADTLREIGRLAKKYHVLVFSDEIHCDLTAPGCKYVPYASVSPECRDNSITAVAPTKAFSIPGLQSAAVIVPEQGTRQRMDRALNTDEVAEPNAFAVDAAIAAFSGEGWAWLTELREYIESNKRYVKDCLAAKAPTVGVTKQDATYLMWLDVSAYTEDSARLAAFIRKETGLFLSAGKVYGGDGSRFLRLNVACPKTLLEDGTERLCEGLRKYKEKDQREQR